MGLAVLAQLVATEDFGAWAVYVTIPEPLAEAGTPGAALLEAQPGFWPGFFRKEAPRERGDVEKPAQRLLRRILDDLLTLRSPVE